MTVMGQGRSVEHCCFCGRVALGLQGQDAYLEPHLLRRDGSDELLVVAGMFGPCHLKCLLASGTAATWAARMRERYATPHNARVVRTGVDSLACYSKQAKTITVIRDDGWCVTLPAASLDQAQSVVSGDTRVPGESECRFPGDALPGGHHKPSVTVKLGDLVDALGIRDDLLWPGAITESKAGQPRPAADDSGDLFAVFEYLVALRHEDYVLACTASGRKAKV